MMLERVTEQYVSAAPTSSADRVHVLHRDYESRSRTVLKIAGTFKYATDPDAPPIGRHRSQVEALLRDEIASIKQSLINEIRTPLCD
jgi:hypothetical protein